MADDAETLRTPLFGPRLKIERAERHLHEFEQTFLTYIHEEFERITTEPQRTGIAEIGCELPHHVPTIIGDVLHNLRSALDHAYCVLTELNGGTVDRNTKFPFGKDRIPLEGSINGHVNLGITPHREVLNFILNEVQPYSGGNGGLYGLSVLNNADKHIVLTPARVATAVHGLVLHRGEGKTIRINNGVRFGAGEGSKPAATFRPIERVEFEKDGQITYNIVFAKGQPLEGEGVIDTLSKFLVLTRGVIDTLEDRFLYTVLR